jgi:hypothetical protein
MSPDAHIFTPEARALIVAGSGGLARRLTVLSYTSMEEAADRGSTLVREEHVRAALATRGLRQPPPKQLHEQPRLEPVPAPQPAPGLFERLFTRLRRAG